MSLLSTDITKVKRLSLKEVKLPTSERRVEFIYTNIDKLNDKEELLLLQKIEIIDKAFSKFVKIVDLDFTLNFIINSVLDKGLNFTNKDYDYFEFKIKNLNNTNKQFKHSNTNKVDKEAKNEQKNNKGLILETPIIQGLVNSFNLVI